VAKANLRVLRWIGTVPAVGVCTACDLQFKVPATPLKRVADAQESLRKQFVEHKCHLKNGVGGLGHPENVASDF
jgi:hypothetical protein